MNKKYLFGIIGLAVGIAISFYWTRSYNATNAKTSTAPSPGGMAGGASSGDQKAMMEEIAKVMETARSNPKDFKAQLEAAKAQSQIGRKKETVEFLERAYDASPGEFAEIGAAGFVGQYYFDQKKHSDAEKWFNRALATEKKDEDKAEIHIILAESFNGREPAQPDKAIQELQSALKINPKNAHAFGHMVEAYALKKDAKSAEEALNKLKEVEPTNKRISVLQTLIADVKAGKPIILPSE